MYEAQGIYVDARGIRHADPHIDASLINAAVGIAPTFAVYVAGQDEMVFQEPGEIVPQTVPSSLAEHVERELDAARPLLLPWRLHIGDSAVAQNAMSMALIYALTRQEALKDLIGKSIYGDAWERVPSESGIGSYRVSPGLFIGTAGHSHFTLSDFSAPPLHAQHTPDAYFSYRAMRGAPVSRTSFAAPERWLAPLLAYARERGVTPHPGLTALEKHVR